MSSGPDDGPACCAPVQQGCDTEPLELAWMRCRADRICAAAGALMEDAYRSAAPHARSLSITSLQAVGRRCEKEAQGIQQQFTSQDVARGHWGVHPSSSQATAAATCPPHVQTDWAQIAITNANRLGAPGAGDVAAVGAEGLGEGAHHDVHVGGVHAQVLAHAPPRAAHRADGVRLVQVHIRLQLHI